MVIIKKINKIRKNQLNFNHRRWEELHTSVSFCGQTRKLLDTKLQISTRCNHIIIYWFFLHPIRISVYILQKRMERKGMVYIYFPSSRSSMKGIRVFGSQSMCRQEKKIKSNNNNFFEKKISSAT